MYSNTLGGFLPIEFIQHADIIEKTPIEHVITSNAFKTFAVQYKMEDQSIIDVLAVWTKSDFYSNPGNVMLRSKGDYLLRLEEKEVLDYSFVLATYRNEEGEKFYTVSYSLEHQLYDEFELFSGWSQDQFETSLSVYYYEYKFDNKELIEEFLEAFILKMDEYGDLIQYVETFNCPKTYVKEFSCNTDGMKMTVHNDSPSFYAELYANDEWNNVLISNQEVKEYNVECEILDAQHLILNGMYEDRDVFFVETAQLSSNQNIIENVQISVFPNPVVDVIKVVGDDIETTRLLDFNGRTILFSKSNQPQFNVTDLPSGKYYIDIKTAQSRITKKVIVI